MASAPQCENVTQTQRNNEMGDTNISKSSDHNDESDLRQCWVCGEKSSTYHYGVVSCDGCKSFFSRSQSLHTAYKCGNQTCTVNRLTRNQCQYCRWIKCLAVGMSKEACKLGRRSKKLKADMKKKSLLLKEVEQNSEQANNIVPEELATSKRIRLNETDVNATSASNNVTQQVSENEKPGKLKIDTSMGKTNHVDNHHVQCDQDKDTSSTENNIDKCDVAMEWFDIKPSVNESILANRIPTTASPYDQKVQQLERLTVKELVRRMHQTQYNTFQSRHIEGKNKALAGQHHTPASLERLWGAITSSFTHLIEGVVTFAKRLPGFRQLDLDDRMVITKLGCFEVVTCSLRIIPCQ
uniref:Nuclear receptor ROR-beta-like n=1 Tax=Saccoglossus kowalevskii TaxID=10224 RepID=A0ABM0MC86_SACKO|nr:PREDICTED: nuclear receptor ROR-beta-like [Saccoglossus kowalevskii]